MMARTVVWRRWPTWPFFAPSMRSLRPPLLRRLRRGGAAALQALPPGMRAGVEYCGRCWFRFGELVEMTPCTPETCEGKAADMADATTNHQCTVPDCRACSGEGCYFCGAGLWRSDLFGALCAHDVVDRHRRPGAVATVTASLPADPVDDDAGTAGTIPSLKEECEQLRRELTPEELADVLARRTRAKKRGAYWTSPVGRAELREDFDQHDDGNAVRPLLDALDAAEKERDELRDEYVAQSGRLVEAITRFGSMLTERDVLRARVADLEAASAETAKAAPLQALGRTCCLCSAVVALVERIKDGRLVWTGTEWASE